MKQHAIWLMGGLGNQAFQLNQGLFLKTLGLDVVFIDNLLQKNFLTSRILNWTCHGKYCDEIFDIETVTSKTLLPALAAKVYQSEYSRFYEKYINNTKNLKSKNLFGYFQSSLEINQIALVLPENKNILFEGSNYVVHLRFGDALRPKENISYYKKALRLAKEMYPKSIWTIVTDDKSQAENIVNEISGFKYKFNNGSVVDDFLLLCSCDKIICSNSTFSWWGAQLNKKPSTIIASSLLFKYLPMFSNEKEVILIGDK